MILRKYILILICLLNWNLAACTGSGSPVSPLTQSFDNNATNPGNSGVNTGPNSSSDSSSTPEEKTVPDTTNTEGGGAIAFLTPPAQPTQPLTPHLGLYVDGIVILSGTNQNTTCEKELENIPTVKSWAREAGGAWKLTYVLDKYESPEDANNPYLVSPCGSFRANLGLLLGPAHNPCLWNNEAKLTAHYKDSKGTVYTGESHLYTCQNFNSLPKAIIVLENKTHQMMMSPSDLWK